MIPGETTRTREEPASTGSADERPETSGKPAPAVRVARYVRERWAREEPGEMCFDRDDSTMARLLAFLDGTATEANAQGVRSHLLQCPRCRFVYASIREGEGAHGRGDRARTGDEPVISDRGAVG